MSIILAIHSQSCLQIMKKNFFSFSQKKEAYYRSSHRFSQNCCSEPGCLFTSHLCEAADKAGSAPTLTYQSLLHKEEQLTHTSWCVVDEED